MVPYCYLQDLLLQIEKYLQLLANVATVGVKITYNNNRLTHGPVRVTPWSSHLIVVCRGLVINCNARPVRITLSSHLIGVCRGHVVCWLSRQPKLRYSPILYVVQYPGSVQYPGPIVSYRLCVLSLCGFFVVYYTTTTTTRCMKWQNKKCIIYLAF